MFKVQNLKAGPGLTSIVPDRQRKTRAMECLRDIGIEEDKWNQKE